MHKWYNWKKIFYMCPIVVFDRPNYFYKSISSKAAKYFLRNRIPVKYLNSLKRNCLPNGLMLKIN